MNHCNALLALVVASTYLTAGRSFAPANAARLSTKHASYTTASSNRNPTTERGYFLEYRDRTPTTAATFSWSRRESESIALRRRLLAVSATGTSAVKAEDDTFEVEIPAGRELAPDEGRVKSFEDWCTVVGCKGVARLSHADFEGLRGLMTKDAVGPWQPVATIPTSLLLEECAEFSPEGEAPTPPAPLSGEAWKQCPWWIRLGVRLLEEKATGGEYRLREYVGILPEAGGTGTPLNWSAEQLERVYYPYLRSQVSVQRRLFQGFRKFLLADATRAGDTRPTERGNDSLVSALADSVTFNWALECVLSRAFQLPPDSATSLTFDDGDDAPTRAPEVEPPPPTEARMALLPLIDSMNHYSRMPTHMYWEADGAISVSVGAPLDPGDHAFLSYGPVSNDGLLQYYGFVERDNPSDTYVLQDMGKWLREDGLLGANLLSRLLSCPAARETWRYLRRGVLLRDAVHPTTMQAIRVVCCERRGTSNPSEGASDGSDNADASPWNGTEADLARFSAPVSLVSEISAFEILMRYSAREADAWGDAGVAAAQAEDPTAPGLDGDLDGLGLDPDRRLMLSVFRQEKLGLLRGIVGRLTHMRKVSDLLKRPIKMPMVKSPPPVLGAPTLRAS